MRRDGEIVAPPHHATYWLLIAALSGAALFAAGVSIWLVFPRYDAAIAALLHVTSGSISALWLGGLTTVGSAAVMIPFGLLACTWLMKTQRAHDAIWLFATIATGRIGIEVVKWLIDRARPPMSGRLVDVVTASFPSSHSAGTMLTVMACCLTFRVRWPIWAAGSALIACIGLSRIMLGVHWPSDVLAGWGLGLLWVMISYTAFGAFFPVRPLRYRD